MLCDGPIDGWLNVLINTIKQTLVDKLFVTLITEPTDGTNGAPQQNAAAGEAVSQKSLETTFDRIEQFFSLDNNTEVGLKLLDNTGVAAIVI